MTAREKLAELLCQKTGALFCAENILQNNPAVVHYQDVCLWDAWGTLPATKDLPLRKIHVYSWDTMTSCAKHGITLNERDHNDFEVSSGE